tara:strand:+ start:2043 stop:2237 length:195 start_codon:yes stop_codon:yes gene_type:complete
MILLADGTDGAGWSPYGDTPAEIAANMKARTFKAGIGPVICVRPGPAPKNKKLVGRLIKLSKKL